MNQPVARSSSIQRLLCAGAATALVACGSKPPLAAPLKPPPVLTIELHAGPALNPDLNRRPSPLVVRIYLLKSASPFEGADFLTLYERDQATLGADLVSREEFVVQPSATRQLMHELKPETCCVGIVGAFRDLESARWRALVNLLPARDNNVTFTLDGVAVQGAAALTSERPR